MVKKTITIQGKLFTYDDETEDIDYAHIEEIPEEEAHKLLELTKRLFEAKGLFFCLAYGTLLGAIREKGIIKGDEDVDVLTDDEEALRNNLPFLQKNGLCVCRITPGSLYSFKAGSKYYIDVYIRREFKKSTIWHYWCYSIVGKAIPKSCFSGYETIEFVGGRYCIPKHPEKVLRIWYGKNWRTPIQGHGLWKSEVASHYYWRKKIKPAITKAIRLITQ